MADFDTAYAITRIHEGGYVNNPKDTGGETYKGVSRKNNPGWAGWAIIDEQKQKPGFPGNLKSRTAELDPLVRQLFKANYWDVVWGDRILHQKVANDLFDFAINAGPAVSIRKAEKQFGMKETGRMSADLLTRLNAIV